jgi:hypothetical protein
VQQHLREKRFFYLRELTNIASGEILQVYVDAGQIEKDLDADEVKALKSAIE